MARVKCKYCGETFDRATQPYVAIPTGQTHRYAHSACYLRERVSNPKLPMYEIIDPTAIVKCIYCKKDINKNTMSYRLIAPGKYAHASCVEKEEKREKTDEEKLDEYIMKIFKAEFVPARIQKQIKTYISDYNYTYSGILKTLKYFIEVKGNSIAEYGDTIGIVPYVYRRAHDYYYAIWAAQEKNKYKQLNDYIDTDVKIIKIPIPKTQARKRQFFTFLDEEEAQNEQ